MKEIDVENVVKHFKGINTDEKSPDFIFEALFIEQ